MPTITRMVDGCCHVKSSSWLDFVAQARLGPGPEARGSGVNESKSTYWDDNVGWEGALNLAYNGWHEGARKVQEFEARLGNVAGKIIPTHDWSYDVEGGNFDIGRVLEGEPECWLAPNLAYIAGQGRLIRIVFNIATSAAFGSDAIFNRGLCVCALVACLERAGHSCEVIACSATSAGGEKALAVIEMPVKQFGDPLNMANMAFVLAHPAAQRRIEFTVWDQLPLSVRKTMRHSYGRPVNNYGPLESDKGDIGIDCLKLGYVPTKPEAVEDWVREQLLLQGIELNRNVY